MHDTSARWLFDRERRDLSHGCIRVEKPEELADWVLRGNPGGREIAWLKYARDGTDFRQG